MEEAERAAADKEMLEAAGHSEAAAGKEPMLRLLHLIARCPKAAGDHRPDPPHSKQLALIGAVGHWQGPPHSQAAGDLMEDPHHPQEAGDHGQGTLFSSSSLAHGRQEPQHLMSADTR